MDNAYSTYSVLRLYPKVISAIIKGKESDTKTQPQQVVINASTNKLLTLKNSLANMLIWHIS